MERKLQDLPAETFDLVVVGGGVYGLFAAWDAALRGLSVALVERGDFGGATSWNTLRIIHGGLRYLQHADIRRMRQSIYDRSVFLRSAPHLIRPIPFFIPTYGHALRGWEVMSVALRMNDLVGFDRNRNQDPANRIPGGRVISRRDCLREFPDLESSDLTGAAVYYDCQMPSSERVVVAIARSASGAGARLANYAEVVGFLGDERQVTGVRVRDRLTDDEFDIRARVVLNTCGPWADRVLEMLHARASRKPVALSKAFNLHVDRDLTHGYALGVYSKSGFEDRDALLNKGSRLFFLTPAENGSLIGTVHLPHSGDVDASAATPAEIETFLAQVNQAYPAARLSPENVRLVHSGLLPMKEPRSPDDEVQLLKRCRFRDHQREDGVAGLLSVVGVKFTEARRVAAHAVDRVFGKLDRSGPGSATARTPLHGGEIRRLEEFRAEQIRKESYRLEESWVRHLVSRYGSAYSEVSDCLDRGASEGRPGSTGDERVAAEVRHAVRREMARRLSDVVFRRTAVGAAGDPGDAALGLCAAVMARELGWSESATNRELDRVRAVFAK